MAMVAARAGVSTQTVSLAFNSPHRLRPETVRRVFKAVDELGFRPNQAARSLRTNSARAIGYRLFPASRGGSGGVLEQYLYALSVAARQAGHGVLCHAIDEDEEEVRVFDELYRRNTVDCFVVTATRYGDPRVPWLLDRKIPFVAFGRPWGLDLSACSWVDVDGAAGTEQAVAHVAALGHTRIAFLGWERPNGLGEDRESGWYRAMLARGLSVDGLVHRCADGIEPGATAAAAILDAPRPPTAIVCASDSLAIGAMRAGQVRGLRPGTDLAVVGFDGSIGAEVVRPGLTTLAQPLDVAARHTMRLLVDLLSGEPAAPEQVLLRPTLIARGSTVAGSDTGQDTGPGAG